MWVRLCKISVQNIDERNVWSKSKPVTRFYLFFILCVDARRLAVCFHKIPSIVMLTTR